MRLTPMKYRWAFIHSAQWPTRQTRRKLGSAQDHHRWLGSICVRCSTLLADLSILGFVPPEMERCYLCLLTPCSVPINRTISHYFTVLLHSTFAYHNATTTTTCAARTTTIAYYQCNCIMYPLHWLYGWGFGFWNWHQLGWLGPFYPSENITKILPKLDSTVAQHCVWDSSLKVVAGIPTLFCNI